MPADIGSFIRDLRSNARISLRELADRAGVSNPYLSQIERGLRRPSAEVLSQIADALRVSTALMYLRAGLLPDKDGHSVLGAIAADPDLTAAQKQSLTQIYEAFRRENARAGVATDQRPGPSAGAPARDGGVAAALRRGPNTFTTDEGAAMATEPETVRTSHPRRSGRGRADQKEEHQS